MRKKSYGGALLATKCPRCREGNLFVYPATDLMRFSKMNDVCPVCHIRLEPEPGFYQGAMYVGYAFTVGAILLLGGAIYLISNPAPWVYITTVIAVMVVLAPLNFRYSRALYLYLFGGIRYHDQSQPK